MKLPVRFIEGEYCPVASKGGWIVPLNGWHVPTVHPDVVCAALDQIGLVKGKDYRIYTSGLGDLRLVRVIILDDESFIMAKMVL